MNKEEKSMIPIYNPSYTGEENATIHNCIENADCGELVTLIKELRKIYNNKSVEELFSQLIKENRQRENLKQVYNMLQDCIKELTAYCENSRKYEEATIIRKEFEAYKNLKGKTVRGQSTIDGFINNVADKLTNYGIYESEEFIRKATFSEKSKSGIKKPQKPSTYYASIEEVPVTQYSDDELLEQLGESSLKYILIAMLERVGTEKQEDIIPMLLFFNRKYNTQASHKKKENQSIFTTTDWTIPEYKDEIKKKIEEIHSLTDEATQYE